MTEFIHTTQTGEEIPLSKITDGHLVHIVAFIERRAKLGITIQTGGGGVDVDDIWFDEETLSYEDSLTHLNYHIYKAELDKRSKNWNK